MFTKVFMVQYIYKIYNFLTFYLKKTYFLSFFITTKYFQK